MAMKKIWENIEYWYCLGYKIQHTHIHTHIYKNILQECLKKDMICSYYLLTPNSTCSINVITVIRGCHDEQLGNELLDIVGTI